MCDFWMYCVNLGVLIRKGDDGPCKKYTNTVTVQFTDTLHMVDLFTEINHT